MTYKEQLDLLARDARNNPSKLVTAQLMATSLMMQWEGGTAQCDPNNISQTAIKLMKQPGFKEMMKDPLAAKLAQQGKHLELIQLMDLKENELRQQREAYERPKSGVKQDAKFLKDAADALKDGTAKGRPAELEKKTQQYQEMIKQVEAAQTKAQSGVPLSAAENKAMVTAIKKYIDGGTNVAGGTKKAPHYKEAMCVLKQFMPEKEFNNYCKEQELAHPKKKGTRKIDPNSFIYERMVSKVKTAEEIRNETKRQLAVNFNEDGCATILAVRNLSKGNSNALITPEMLEAEKARLKESGSAFNAAMSNEKDRELFKELAAAGRAVELGKELEKASKNHVIGSAQWNINRSIRALTEGGPLNRHNTADHLATIYVAHELARNSGPDTKIDRKTIDLAKQNVLNDPSFRRLVDRYIAEPEYRNKVNKELSLDKTGSILPAELNTIRNPRPQRQHAPQERRQEQPQARQPQQGVPVA